MIPRRRFVLGLLCFAWLAASTSAASAPKPEKKAAPTPGMELAALTTQVTGIAISPLLGVSAVGAYQYFKADTPAAKAKLPWFAHPAFWGFGLLIVGACGLKDTCGAVLPPGLKKPFDVLEVVENKASGLVATGAVIPLLVNMASKYLGGTPAGGAMNLSVDGLAVIQFGAIDFSWLLNLVMIPLAVAVFLIVWVVSHAITVLILLSPWGAVDAILKSARTAVLGLLTATAYVDPVVGATLSVVIIIVAYFAAGWAIRLTVFGSIFTWDFLSFRRHRFTPAANGNWVFLGREIKDTPIRTWGRLLRLEDGTRQLAFRPWLFLPERTITLPADGLAVGRGLFWPTVEFRDTDGKDRTLLTLPPRYKGHEAALAEVCAIREVREVGLRRGWAALKELFGGRGPRRAVPA